MPDEEAAMRTRHRPGLLAPAAWTGVVSRVALAAAAMAVLVTGVRADGPSPKEKPALDALDRTIDGAVCYTRKGRVHKVVIGEWREVALGAGDYARWAPDGRYLAVWKGGTVLRVSADGSERVELVKGADKKDGCPVEYHPSGRAIVFWNKGKGFHLVDVETRKVEPLGAPGEYSGSPCLSADGRRMACRWGNNLFAVDLVAGTHRKYAKGCSPGVSPDGRLLMNNNGGHRTVTVQTWDGGPKTKLDTRTAAPDDRWDNHHWSNHNDYLAAQGEGRRGEAYVVQVSTNRCTRVSWTGHVGYPDLHVAGAGGEAEEKPKKRVPRLMAPLGPEEAPGAARVSPGGDAPGGRPSR